MNAEDIRKLGEAIAQHAELLAALDAVEDDPILVPERSKSLGLLKNARLIEAIDDDTYFSGEYYELLRKTIQSSNYEINTMPDIQVWLADVTHLAHQYAELEQGTQDEERVAIRKSIAKTLHYMSSNLKSLIREIDLKASSEFGYCKNLQAKIREGHYYRERTADVLKKLELLDYEALSRISTHPDIEKLTLGKFFVKIDLLRSALSLVLNKLQRLSISFREIELRTRQYQRILHALNNHQLDTKEIFDRINWEQSTLLNSVGNGAISKISAGFNYAQNSAFAQARFDDIAQKIKLPTLAQRPQTTEAVVALEADEPELPSPDTDSEATYLIRHQQALSRLLLQTGDPLSVIGYWQATPDLQQQMSADAWLLEMSHWLIEAQQDIPETLGRLTLRHQEHPIYQQSDIVLVSDIEVSFIPSCASRNKQAGDVVP